MTPLQAISNLPPAPLRPADAHKGTFGTVIVVGGSNTMLGAPALAAIAAFRTGAGLVKIAAPASLFPHILTLASSATGISLEPDVEQALQMLEQADPHRRAVLAIGPGLGQQDWTDRLVLRLLAGPRRVVLDADGLNALARSGLTRPLTTNAPTPIFTPHPGEFSRLTAPLGITDSPLDPAFRPQAVARLAQAHQAIVLLKGAHSLVSDGSQVYVNPTGNPALATAGSGDVLTGCIAGLLAQSMSPWDACRLGAYLHGLAADLWAQTHGHAGMLATELSQRLPDALHQYRCSDNAGGKSHKP